MKKNSIDSVLGKKQYKNILDYLEKYPEGLEHSDILYLLSNVEVMNQWEKEKKFKEIRKNIIPSAQRLSNIITTLIELSLIYKDGKRYKPSKQSLEIKSLYENKLILNHYLTIVKYHHILKHKIKNSGKKYKRVKPKSLSRTKKGKESIVNSIILPQLQIYGTNIDMIPEKKLTSALSKIQEGVKEIEEAKNKTINEKANETISKLESKPPGPREIYLPFWADAVQSGEEDVPDENVTADELKAWEIKRVKKLISENIERQKANNITLIFNTNKEEIIKIKY